MRHPGAKRKAVLEGNTSRVSLLRGLQARITLSYVWVTVVSLLLIEFIFISSILGFAVNSAFADVLYPYVATQVAREYALGATLQADGAVLNPQTTFLPNQPGSLIPASDGGDLPLPDAGHYSISYTSGLLPATQTVDFGLLIDPNGNVLASSYPGRYPDHRLASSLLPARKQAISTALSSGKAGSKSEPAPDGYTVWAVVPVWGKGWRPIGAIYLQGDLPNILQHAHALNVGHALILAVLSGLILSILTAPIGGLFGYMTTRGMVRRLRKLVAATTAFASGDYAQRVPVARKDEIGQLEGHFNQMAEQLAASIRERQELAGHNARLAERARISRELHDAVSQDLFSLRMLAGGLQRALPPGSPLAPQIASLQDMATSMIREMRALLLELRPAQFEHLGLAEALEDLATAYRTRLGITMTTAIKTTALPATIEQAILRITQEALSNAARHADATAITLELTPQEDRITLIISDNGQGFTPAQDETQHGVGLRSMQERMQELGGTFLIESTPGQGTRVQVSFPCSPAPEAATGAKQ